MLDRIITSKTRKELLKINFAYNSEIMPIKIDGDVWISRLFYNNKDYIVRYYDVDNSVEFINKFLYACKSGLCKLKLLGYTDKILVYEDVKNNGNYRKIDIKNDIDLIAKWYKNLHSIKTNNFSNYCSYFTYENVMKVIQKYHFNYNEAMTLIVKNFSNISIKLNRHNECLILDDFDDKKFILKSDTNEIECLSFDNLKVGFCYIDIMKICACVSEEIRNQLIETYGEISKDEMIMCEVIDPIIRLYLLTNKENVDEESKLLEIISNKKYAEKVRNLIEWY